MKLNEKFLEILVKGLERSLVRLKRVTREEWQIHEMKIYPFKPEERESICVYLTTESEYDFSGVLSVSFDDSTEILKYFITNYTPKFNTIEMAEFFVNELGNIILNGCLSEFANLFEVKIIPNSPKTIKGKESFIIENILNMIEKSKNNAVIFSKVVLKVKNDIPINIYCFLPSKIISKL